jgi:hypothetical protein
MTASEYPPYVNGYGGITKLFSQIKSAAVPPKFNQDFISTVLGLKSSSYRAMIPLLKRLGFVDAANIPTQAYKDFRDESQSKAVMARQLKEAYSSLFAANEYAWKLDKKDLISKLKNFTGSGADDPVLGAVASTFIELSKLANWTAGDPASKKNEKKIDEGPVDDITAKSGGTQNFDGRFGLSYTINLNLPATTEVEVFNAIFKSLRDNLLREK